MTSGLLARLSICLAVLGTFNVSESQGSIICIEYSEQGDDLVFDYSGSLNINSLFRISGSTVAIGNQDNFGLDKPAFYALAGTHSRLGTISGVTASSSNYWDNDFSITSSNISVALYSDFFGFKYEAGNNRVILFGGLNYQAGTSISGQLIAKGYTIADTGIRDWSVDMGDVGKIIIKAKGGGDGSGGVPEPASVIIWSVFGCCGLAGGAYRRSKSLKKSAES